MMDIKKHTSFVLFSIVFLLSYLQAMIAFKVLLLCALACLQVESATFKEQRDGFVVIGGKQYYFDEYSHDHTAAEAAAACEKRNMKLISFDTSAKEAMISEYILTAGLESAHWTSGKRVNGTHYIWESTGKYFTESDYTNWQTNRYEPNFDGDCIVQTGGIYTKKWWDFYCDDLNSFICEEL